METLFFVGECFPCCKMLQKNVLHQGKASFARGKNPPLVDKSKGSELAIQSKKINRNPVFFEQVPASFSNKPSTSDFPNTCRCHKNMSFSLTDPKQGSSRHHRMLSTSTHALLFCQQFQCKKLLSA